MESGKAFILSTAHTHSGIRSPAKSNSSITSDTQSPYEAICSQLNFSQNFLGVADNTNVRNPGNVYPEYAYCINCTNIFYNGNLRSQEICFNATGGSEDDGNPFILPWYFQIIYIVAFVSMVLIAAGGNIIVIWIVLAHKRMRTVTNYFLVNLAAADAAISILNTLFNFEYLLYQNWPFGRIYCKFTQFIAPGTISASVFTFMAIAIDR